MQVRAALRVDDCGVGGTAGLPHRLDKIVRLFPSGRGLDGDGAVGGFDAFGGLAASFCRGGGRRR